MVDKFSLKYKYFSDFEVFNGNFSCHKFQSICNLSNNIQFEDEAMTRSFVTVVMKFLFKNKNIFTDKVRSYFESEKKMLTFVENLLIRLISIIDINSYAVINLNYKSSNLKTAVILFGNITSKLLFFFLRLKIT